MSHTIPCYHLNMQNSRTFKNSQFLIILANRASLLWQYEHGQPKMSEIFKACLFNLGLQFCFNIWNVCGCCLKVCTTWNKRTKLQSWDLTQELLRNSFLFCHSVPNRSMISHQAGLARVFSHQKRNKTSPLADLSPLSCCLSGAEFSLDRWEKEG